MEGHKIIFALKYLKSFHRNNKPSIKLEHHWSLLGLPKWHRNTVMGTEGHSDNTQSRAVPLVLEQPLFKCDPFKNIKLKYFLLSVQKIVKFNWVQHHSKLKEVFCLLPSKGQLSLAIKLGFSTHSRNVEDQNIDLIWALTNLQLLKHIGMIAGLLVYNLIGTSSLAPVANKKTEGLHVLNPHITELFISKQIQILIFSLCQARILDSALL